MNHGSRDRSRLAYPGILTMLILAAAFPVALVITNPTLMLERGWEQYVGTSIYLIAVVVLSRQLFRLWADERACDEAPTWLAHPETISDDDRRVVPSRLRGLLAQAPERTVTQLMDLNREASALDQEQAHGQFTLTRYILYLLPVIGFIGTVEGISKALMKISEVLPLIKQLDGFLSNLGGVTSALQIAFDSTLLALFLSAALMFVQTLVHRRSEILLAQVDRWIVEQVLPRIAVADAAPQDLAGLAPQLARVESALDAFATRLVPLVSRFSEAVDRLPAALEGVERGAETISRAGAHFEAIPQVAEAARQAVAALGRIETALAAEASPDAQLEQLRQGIERVSVGVEALPKQLARTQETLANATNGRLDRALGGIQEVLGPPLRRIESTLVAAQAPDERIDRIQKGINRTCTGIESLAGQFAQVFERNNRTTQEQLARTLDSLKDALDLLNVSMEQGNSLYRSIVKKILPVYATPPSDERAA